MDLDQIKADNVERKLRHEVADAFSDPRDGAILFLSDKAAEVIDELVTEVERLTAALGEYAKEENWLPCSDDDRSDAPHDWWLGVKDRTDCEDGPTLARQVLGLES